MRNSAVPRQEVTFFEALPLEAQQALRRLAGRKDYPDGSTVFATGQEPDVIFLLNAGQIRVTTSSSAHGAVTLRIAGRGEVLGLSAAITGSRHEASAKAVGPVQGDLINRADFLRFLEEHPAAGFQVVQKLSHDISRAQV